MFPYRYEHYNGYACLHMCIRRMAAKANTKAGMTSNGLLQHAIFFSSMTMCNSAVCPAEKESGEHRPENMNASPEYGVFFVSIFGWCLFSQRTHAIAFVFGARECTNSAQSLTCLQLEYGWPYLFVHRRLGRFIFPICMHAVDRIVRYFYATARSKYRYPFTWPLGRWPMHTLP